MKGVVAEEAECDQFDAVEVILRRLARESCWSIAGSFRCHHITRQNPRCIAKEEMRADVVLYSRRSGSPITSLTDSGVEAPTGQTKQQSASCVFVPELSIAGAARQGSTKRVVKHRERGKGGKGEKVSRPLSNP